DSRLHRLQRLPRVKVAVLAPSVFPWANLSHLPPALWQLCCDMFWLRNVNWFLGLTQSAPVPMVLSSNVPAFTASTQYSVALVFSWNGCLQPHPATSFQPSVVGCDVPDLSYPYAISTLSLV